MLVLQCFFLVIRAPKLARIHTTTLFGGQPRLRFCAEISAVNDKCHYLGGSGCWEGVNQTRNRLWWRVAHAVAEQDRGTVLRIHCWRRRHVIGFALVNDITFTWDATLLNT